MWAVGLKAGSGIGHTFRKIIQLKPVAPAGVRDVAQAREIAIRLRERQLALVALKFNKDLTACRRPYAKMNDSALLSLRPDRQASYSRLR